MTGSSCPQEVALYQDILFYDGKTTTFLNDYLDDEIAPENEELYNVLELAYQIR